MNASSNRRPALHFIVANRQLLTHSLDAVFGDVELVTFFANQCANVANCQVLTRSTPS